MDDTESSKLRQLRKELGMTVEKFANEFAIADKTQTAYENGSRTIPADYAIKVCNRYGVTLDWLYGRVESKNESDLMLSIIFALEKIFVIDWKIITPRYSYRELTLFIDKTFRKYLSEIRDLQNMHYSNSPITDEMYIATRRAIQERYAPYFKKLFGETNCGFDKTKFINIEAVKDVNLLDYL